MDLLQRNISKRKDRLKMRAELALNEIFKGKPPSPEALAENFEREVARLKMKVSQRQDSSRVSFRAFTGLYACSLSICGVAIFQGCPHPR